MADTGAEELEALNARLTPILSFEHKIATDILELYNREGMTAATNDAELQRLSTN